MSWFTLHLVTVSRFPHWWGGHGYLARLMSEAVLPLLLIAIVSWWTIKKWKAVFLSACLLSALAGLAIHVPQGMYNLSTQTWNNEPDIDSYSEAVFVWHYPQFLATEKRNLNKYDTTIDPTDWAPGTFHFRQGWWRNESWGRWALKSTAVVRAYNVELPATLHFEATSWPAQTGPQICHIFVDNKRIGTVTVLTKPWVWQGFNVAIPGKGIRTIAVEFRFESLFPDEGGKHRLRALPFRGIRVVPVK